MKLNEPANDSPVVTPLKISSVLGQKLSKVEPTTATHTSETTENGGDDEEFDNFPEDDGDSVKDEDIALTDFIKEKKMENVKLHEQPEEASGGGIIVAGVGGGIDNNDTAETEEESSCVGKKKGVRKKRSINWEEAERSLLVEVIKPKVDFVENKSVDAKSIKSKRMAWLHVTKQFNSLNFRHRSLEQIQVQWRSMKNSSKKEYQQKNPKAILPLEGIQMLEFMEEMQKEPIMGGTRSQTRNSSIQHSVKKELNDDLEEDEEEDTPLAALPTILQNHSNSEDTQPTTSTLALPSPPPTSAESQNVEFLHQQQQQQQQQQEQFYDINNIRAKKKRSLPKLKQKNIKTKSPLLAAKLQEKSITGTGGGVIGLKIKRQKCDNSTSSSSLTDVSTTGLTMNTTPTNYHINDSNKPITLTTSTLTTPPPSPPVCLDDKFKRQLFDLIKRSRLSEIDYARKEHEQKLRHEQQEQELKLRFMTEIHEQRMRFALQEHEARMRVYTFAKKQDTATDANEISVTPKLPDI